MNTFSPLTTNCAKCCFEQNGCILNKRIGYILKGVNVDSDDNSNILMKDFICPYFRTEEWQVAQITNPEIVAGTLWEDIIKKENSIQYDAVILHPDKKKVKSIINKIARFTDKPQSIIIIVSPNREDIEDIKNVLKNTKIKWTISQEIMENSWLNIFKHYNKKTFLLLVTDYIYIDNDWTRDLSNKIQDDLLKFLYATDKKRSMMLIPHYVYNSFYFEYGDKLMDVLKDSISYIIDGSN